MGKKIFLIDDDIIQMRYYLSSLRLKGYDVTMMNNINTVKKNLLSKIKIKVDLFSIDVMMNPSQLYNKNDCEGGLLTGLHLALDLRKKYPIVPIILFSNANLAIVDNSTKQLSLKLKRCAYLKKSDYTPEKFVKFIDDYFEKGCFKTGLLKKFFDSVMLQPNIYGIGINLKK